MFHCCVRGVSNGVPGRLSAFGARVVGVMPAPGFASGGFVTLDDTLNGGFT